MMKLKSLEGLIFLTYLTKYNISTIFKVVELYEYYEELEPHLKKYNIQAITKDQAKRGEEVAMIEAERLKYHSIEAIPYYSEKYPTPLKAAPYNPPILYIRGEFKDGKNLAAVVGSRDISPNGQRKTQLITKSLLDNGYGIVSGLALGVDSIAHQETLNNGGYTIAVLPTSLDTVYPLSNFKLANEILEKGGLLISELIYNINRGKKSFVERNRIQVGLSNVIIPTEMRIESGTMHTINYAQNQKKTIMLPDFEEDLDNNNGIRFLANKHRDSHIGKIEIVRSIDEFLQKIKFIDDERQLKLF